MENPVKRIVPLFAAIASLAVLFSSPASAGSFQTGSFKSFCKYSHTLSDDTIVKPGPPGMSHSHDFGATRSTNARSNVQSLASAPTTCEIKGDLSGYWVP